MAGDEDNRPEANKPEDSKTRAEGAEQQAAVPEAVSGGGVPPEKPPATPPDPPAPDPLGDTLVLVTDVIREEVEAALELLEFVVRNGTKRDNASLPVETLRTIKVTAGKVQLFEFKQAKLEGGPSAAAKLAAVHIKASEWGSFEQAYYALAAFSAPVTIDTLRDTRETSKDSFFNASPAQRFTRQLWAYTVVFVLVVIVGGVIATGADNDRGRWAAFCRHANIYVPILVPWLYGALGACAYLLRTAHDMIAKRCFDVRRQPEYFNRMLLGAVSGGSIVLLVSPSGDDAAVKISAAALGFLAGYSNDLLFNAVERVTNALLPNIGLDTVQKQTLVPKQIELPTGGLTFDDLLKRMEAATKPEDKELYRSLIEKLRDRL